MKKRVVALVLCLVMVLGFTAIRLPGYAETTATATYTVEANKSQVYRGDTIEFTLYLQQTGDMYSLEAKLDIPDGLTYVEGSGKLVDGAGDTLGGEFRLTLYWGEKDGNGNYYWFLNGYSAYAFEGRDKVALLTFEATVDEDAPYGDYKVGVTEDSFAADLYNGFDMTFAPAQITVKEKPVPATGISLDKKDLSLVAGTSQQLVATVTPGNSTDKVVWTSSNDKVATVSNDGTVKAVGVGTATITATAGAHSATCAVTVTCAHENVITKEETDSTCQVQGWDTYKECEDCGQLFDETGEEIWEIPFRPLAAHTGGTADCSHKAICEVCGAEYGDFGDHDYGNLVAGEAATCEEEGMSAHYVCSICKTYFDENKTETTKEALTIPALGHDLGDWQSDGTSHWKECSRCHEKLEQGTCTGGEATCVDKAECEVCGHAYGEVDPNNHKHTAVEDAVEATCSTDGYTGDTYCLDCHELVKAGEVIPATGEHASEEWVSEDGNHWQICDTCGIKFNEGTCTGGEATCVDKAVCEVCGHAYGEVDPDNHKHTEVKDAVEATCIKEGYTGDTYCLDCHELVKAGEVIPATGVHASEEWVSEDGSHWQICDTCGIKFNEGTCTGGEATCVDEAVCEVCGHAYGEVDPDNHKHTEVKDAVEATCTKEGYTGDTYCADCGELIAKGETVAATGVHAPGKDWETDGTYRWQICEDCGAQLNKELVQDSGTQKPDKEDADKEETDKESPETGDSAYLMFWVSVMVVAAAVMAGVNVHARKRSSRR